MTESPQRSRKVQSYPGPQVSGQNLPGREATPSPSFRERQRAAKAQQMSYVPPTQVYQQPSPPNSNSSRPSERSPPPVNPNSRISPQGNSIPRDMNSERPIPPPPPIHSLSQPDIRQTVPPPPPQHTMSQPDVRTMNPSIGYPRPSRVAPAQFLTQFASMEGNWQITEQLMKDIETADLQQAQAAGTMGVAYAGGAVTTAAIFAQGEVGSPPKEGLADRARPSDRVSPKDVDGGQPPASVIRRQTWDGARDRDSPKAWDRPGQSTGSMPPQVQPRLQGRSPDSGDSIPYHTPTASPGEHPSTYPQYDREYYPAPVTSQGRVPTPPNSRKSSNATMPDPMTHRVTPPAVSKLANQTMSNQGAKRIAPDRSLPVQEEAEDDLGVSASNGPREKERRGTFSSSNEYGRRDPEIVDGGRRLQGSPTTPSSEIHPEGRDSRYDSRDDHPTRLSREPSRGEDSETLNEHDEDEDDHGRPSQGSSQEYTPRSPTADLPDRHYTSNADYQQSIRAKTRGGVTDQLGLRGLEQTFDSMKEKPLTSQMGKPLAPPQHQQHQQQLPLQQQLPPQQPQQRPVPSMTPSMPHPSDLQHFFDDAYLQAYFSSSQASRPGAPIPPTPQSHTAAPSPSPLISAMHSDVGRSPAPPIGSPYPYPFSHIRRSDVYMHPPQNLSNYDPNHPAAIQEQMARQLQMYALNNAAMLSDSTLSPSSTPYPGPGYNPWAFLPTTRMGGRAIDSAMSHRSSPSHEPVELAPPPPLRSRSLRKRDNAPNLRSQPPPKPQRKPPPRVQSTQPRDTSPENSSGEETAGEDDKVIDVQYTNEENQWVRGISNDDPGDWVDEDEEGDDDDLLELEFHPTYISNAEKKRRRWELRWDDLVRAFQALDRQTDATMVLLAAPSHSTKQHSLTSRSVRRDPSLLHSPALASMRSAFTHVASQRRTARSRMVTLADRLSLSGSSVDGSDAGSTAREEDLKKALEAALGSLGALGHIYEQREARWREEMRKLSDDRERVELLLGQALGPGISGHGMNGGGR